VALSHGQEGIYVKRLVGQDEQKEKYRDSREEQYIHGHLVKGTGYGFHTGQSYK
jgi:hypothetical protein